MRNRILTFLTALLMLTALLPPSALAYTDTRSIEAVNPLLPPAPYTLSIDESAEVTVLESDPALISAALRDAMEQRTGSITLYCRADHRLTDDELAALFEGAFAETGVETEGDYLRLSWQRYRMDMDCTESEGVFDHTITFHLTYETTAEQEAELAAELDRVLTGFGFTNSTTDYQKIRTIFDYIRTHVTYDYTNLSDSSYRMKYTAYAALLHGTAVCEGYAELFYRMAIPAGLQTRIITGRSNGDNHAWNIVRLGDLYYNIDCTWAAMGDPEHYFLKGASEFSDHRPDSRCSAAAFVSLHPMSDTAYAADPFTDVTDSDYFRTPVLWAVSKGITSGTGADTFSPHALCTRAQAVTLLWKAAGSPAHDHAVSPFTDITPTDYYYNAVLWAAENGITGGIGDGLFGPHRTCTRAEIVTFLHRALQPETVSGENPFVDVAPTDYYCAPVQWAAAAGITSGTAVGMFSPHLPCTRAQIVTFLYEAYK